jgi:hypothetical protein
MDRAQESAVGGIVSAVTGLFRTRRRRWPHEAGPARHAAPFARPMTSGIRRRKRVPKVSATASTLGNVRPEVVGPVAKRGGAFSSVSDIDLQPYRESRRNPCSLPGSAYLALQRLEARMDNGNDPRCSSSCRGVILPKLPPRRSRRVFRPPLQARTVVQTFHLRLLPMRGG